MHAQYHAWNTLYDEYFGNDNFSPRLDEPQKFDELRAIIQRLRAQKIEVSVKVQTERLFVVEAQMEWVEKVENVFYGAAQPTTTTTTTTITTTEEVNY